MIVMRFWGQERAYLDGVKLTGILLSVAIDLGSLSSNVTSLDINLESHDNHVIRQVCHLTPKLTSDPPVPHCTRTPVHHIAHRSPQQ